MTTHRTPGAAPATRLAVCWVILLAALAGLWVWSPFLGEGTAFVVWSGPAAVLVVVSVRWFRARAIEQIPDGRLLWAGVAVGWLVALALTASEIGRRLALDGLIMRQPGVRRVGQLLRWAPLTFGCSVSLAGLAASLEARYRMLNSVSAPRTPSTPPE